MDYERAYKSLVAKVKKAHQFAQTDSTKNVLEDILPQLRESKDERTRKELIQFLTDVKNISEAGRSSWHVRKEDAGMCDSFISYLEKQKDFAANEYWRGFKAGFIEGYEQAEKDLALTIQDLELLHTFLYAVKNNKHGAFTFTRLTDEQYAEVLKRYLAAKK